MKSEFETQKSTQMVDLKEKEMKLQAIEKDIKQLKQEVENREADIKTVRENLELQLKIIAKKKKSLMALMRSELKNFNK